jgi:hypothetical protein
VGSPVFQAAILANTGKILGPVIYRGFGPNTGLPNRALLVSAWCPLARLMDCIVTIIHYSQSNSTIIIFSSKLYNIII